MVFLLADMMRELEVSRELLREQLVAKYIVLDEINKIKQG
jgi:hypothetical protein